jgi:hypothetical protein
MKPTRVPFRSILSARAALSAALVWPFALAIVGVMAGRALYPRDGAAFAAVVDLAGAALIYVAARYALRARTRGAAIGRLVVAKAALSIASVPWRPGFSGYDVVGLVISTVTTLPISFIAPIAMVVVAWPVLRAPSYEAEDRALIWMAVWMLVPNLLNDAFSLTVVARFSHYPALARNLAIQLVLFGTIPVALAVAAAVRVGLRRRWLSSVEAGREPMWRLVDRGESAETDLPVLRSSTPPGPTRILACVLAVSPTDPFREAEGLEPVAIVRSQPP